MADPKPPDPRDPSGASAEAWFFCLRLLGGRYAFDAPLVIEVVRLGPLTRLPAAPSFLPGVFTHRGEVLPVLDVGQLVGQGAVPLRPSTRAAIVHCGPWKVAVVSEAVEGLVAIPRRQLEPRLADAVLGPACCEHAIAAGDLAPDQVAEAFYARKIAF